MRDSETFRTVPSVLINISAIGELQVQAGGSLSSIQADEKPIQERLQSKDGDDLSSGTALERAVPVEDQHDGDAEAQKSPFHSSQFHG